MPTQKGFVAGGQRFEHLNSWCHSEYDRDKGINHQMGRRLVQDILFGADDSLAARGRCARSAATKPDVAHQALVGLGARLWGAWADLN